MNLKKLEMTKTKMVSKVIDHNRKDEINVF